MFLNIVSKIKIDFPVSEFFERFYLFQKFKKLLRLNVTQRL